MTQPQIIAASIVGGLVLLAFIRRTYHLWRITLATLQQLTASVNLNTQATADNTAASQEIIAALGGATANPIPDSVVAQIDANTSAQTAAAAAMRAAIPTP